MRAQKRAARKPPFETAFPCADLSGRSGLRSAGGFGKGEAETDLATLGGGTGFALGALLRGLMSTKTTDFFEDAVHFEAGLEAFKSAVNGLAFADLNFGHSGVGGKRAGRVGE